MESVSEKTDRRSSEVFNVSSSSVWSIISMVAISEGSVEERVALRLSGELADKSMFKGEFELDIAVEFNGDFTVDAVGDFVGDCVGDFVGGSVGNFVGD